LLEQQAEQRAPAHAKRADQVENVLWLKIQDDNATLGVKLATGKSERPEKVAADKRLVRHWRIIRVTNTATGFDSYTLEKTFHDAMTK
jgi:hypothetical protein